MQSPILRLCNYALKICPSMPGLNASMELGAGGMRAQPVKIRRPQRSTACCKSLVKIS